MTVCSFAASYICCCPGAQAGVSDKQTGIKKGTTFEDIERKNWPKPKFNQNVNSTRTLVLDQYKRRNVELTLNIQINCVTLHFSNIITCSAGVVSNKFTAYFLK